MITGLVKHLYMKKVEILEVLAKMKELGYTYEADGATWLRTTDFKDDKDRY